MTLHWTKTKDESVADGYGQNVVYTTTLPNGMRYAVCPTERRPAWVLYVGLASTPEREDSFVSQFDTLRDAKAYVTAQAAAFAVHDNDDPLDGLAPRGPRPTIDHDRGIAEYYERCAAEGRDSGD